MHFERPFWITPHTRDRIRQRYGDRVDSEIEWMINVQLQHPEIPDAARMDISKRGTPALYYAVLIDDIPSTVVVTAPDDVDISQVPRKPDTWPVVVTAYPGRKHIAKYQKRIQELRVQQAKPFERTWQPWEIETVKLMRWIGYTMAEMAVLLRRTERQIERHVPIIQPRWTDEELQIMCDMRAMGATYEEIGKRLGRSPQACKNKMLRHKEWVLSNPERAAFLRILHWIRNPGRLLSHMRRTDMVARVAAMMYGEEGDVAS